MDSFSIGGFALRIAFALALILGIGMSWSIVRRELTGQASVDEVGDNR